MITDFDAFGTVHIISLIIPLLLGASFVIISRRAKTEEEKKRIRIILAVFIGVIRGSRYIMDATVGRFELFDLFSLHICHVDLILLIICLIKPNRILYHFVFLIGIPMGLAVALLPGSVHPTPGLPRAILFIMSHMMLVVGALYLSLVARMRPTLRITAALAIISNVAMLAIYFINKTIGTNFLYINYAPPGTVIENLAGIFGWPGYVFVMDGIAMVLIGIMYLIGCQISEKPYMAYARISKG